ncbi:HD domain-containing protein [Aureimonas phyllosphaerae]|uniref:HD domain-containing protein n=1 Tax=Aureimonas phyllosphaerae TaxID=1166078 RepID=A0A7W6BZ80_9HYPH|nr:HD domain-containing protein [Aureimonas phyllosphaerae]MBB3937903.1 hypothetical protein [Aureimonas phyllosphaerae]MBB3961924.1 hypothetical protein [Aureimonas phyllosphaerae]SFF54731.1 hypothetical protein SAMN05216566_12551 [Aureimonas phyllosphaerae]
MTAWAQTLTGRALDFAEPTIAREHLFGEVAHGLATVNRYAGQLAMPLSVAQHSVMMAEAAFDETDDVELAAFCLLHDAHEAYFGDWPSPAQEAVGEAMARQAVSAGINALAAEALRIRHRRGIAEVKATLDRAVMEAAGLSYTRFQMRGAEVHEFDVRMLRTERDALMPRPPRAWAAVIEGARRLVVRSNPRFKCWAWPEAEDRFRGALARLCPLTEPAALTA